MRVVSYLIILAALSLAPVAFAQPPEGGFYWSSGAEQFGQGVEDDRSFPNTSALAATGTSCLESPAVNIETIAADQPDRGLSVVNCTSGDCADCCDECWPRWNFQFMSLVFWRDNDAHNSGLVRPDMIDFDGGGGPKLLGRLLLNPQQAWEAQWYTFANSGGMLFYNWSDFYLTNYYSSLSNGEINYVHTWNRFSVLGGFRTLRWSETYEQIWASNRRMYQLHTDNDLFGGQVGARWRQDRPKFFWELTGKLGVFGNQANRSQFTTFNFGDSGYSADPRQADFATSIVYEVNLAAGFRLSPVWSLRAGYDFMFIDRLALAPNQYSPNGSRPLATDGNVLLNGFEVGLEALW